MALPDTGVLLRLKRNELLTHEKTWRNLTCILPRERNWSYCMVPTTRQPVNDKIIEIVKFSVDAELRGRDKREHRPFLGQWEQYDCITMDTHLYTPPTCTPPRGNPTVNYGLWVILMCSWRLIDHNTCTTLVGVLIMGAAMHAPVQGAYRGICTFPLLLLWT